MTIPRDDGGRRVLVTGLNGTLAPVLAGALRARGTNVAGWDRKRVPPEDIAACIAELERLRPEKVFHLSLGSETWAAALAGWCARHGVPFLFTSTAMVFDNEPDGPHRVDDPRNAQDDYGRYKIRCEDAIAAASDQAIVARIGWQIGATRGGNNMLEALWRMAGNDGAIRASTAWRPACSFMADTAEGLIRLIEEGRPGVHHLDSNVRDALSFHEIVLRLRAAHNTDWRVDAVDDYVHDQRLLDDRQRLSDLSGTLPGVVPGPHGHGRPGP
jgi:dTDP-4-dehydrorhamnose reductase